jgi:hypothetical protein
MEVLATNHPDSISLLLNGERMLGKGRGKQGESNLVLCITKEFSYPDILN